MDDYRKRYRKAQEDAKELLYQWERRYLAVWDGGSLPLDERCCCIVTGAPYAVRGYRALKDEEETEEVVKEGMRAWLGALHQTGQQGIFQVQRRNKATEVLLAEGGTSSLARAAAGTIPELAAEERWEAFRPLYEQQGLLTGAFHMSRGAWDIILDEMREDFFVSVLLLPAPDKEAEERMQKIQNWEQYLKPYAGFTRTYGNGSRRAEEVVQPVVYEAGEFLKQQRKLFLTQGSRGYFYMAVRYGTHNKEEFDLLEALLKGLLLHLDEEGLAKELVRSFCLSPHMPGSQNIHWIPYLEYKREEPSGEHLFSWNHMEDVLSCCMLPLRSHPGFLVKDYCVNESSFHAFEKNLEVKEDTEKGYIRLGKNAALPLQYLYSHVFISGMTNTGKSTTMRQMIRELHRQDIPVLVIEAAKKEYCHMQDEIEELRVFTPGNDGWPLWINPLEPEDGTLIETHVAGVKRALAASLGDEKPIPEAFEGLLKMTYEKAGWTYGSMACQDPNRPFPTFRNVYENIHEYIREHGVYGREVRQNLIGALTLRAENMYEGALGYLFSRPQGYRAEELLKVPTLIELGDLEQDTAAFLMNILLFKLHCYLKRLPDSPCLKRVIALEEAHNVFAKTIREDTGQAQNNRYFEKMLAEVRSSGTGLILADQRPSIMPEAVLANTGLKITHGLAEAADQEAIGDSMGLTGFQRRKLQELARGECILSMQGQYGQIRIQTAPPPKKKGVENPACLVCRCRYRCRRKNVEGLLDGMADYRRKYYMEKLHRVMFDPKALRRGIDEMMSKEGIVAYQDTRLCLLGEMLGRMEDISFQDARVMAAAYGRGE